MNCFRDRRSVPYSAAQMFALVGDVESYPDFVPLCDEIAVRSRRQIDDGVEALIVDVRAGLDIFRREIATRVTRDSNSKKILVENIGGPFRALAGHWTFRDEPADGAGFAYSTVDFSIGWEFESFALGLLAAAVVDAAYGRYAEAFIRRAGAIYGR